MSNIVATKISTTYLSFALAILNFQAFSTKFRLLIIKFITLRLSIIQHRIYPFLNR